MSWIFWFSWSTFCLRQTWHPRQISQGLRSFIFRCKMPWRIILPKFLVWISSFPLSLQRAFLSYSICFQRRFRPSEHQCKFLGWCHDTHAHPQELDGLTDVQVGEEASLTSTARGNDSIARWMSGSYGQENVLRNHSDLLHWLGVCTSPAHGAEPGSLIRF